jgi:hypothetical protein
MFENLKEVVMNGICIMHFKTGCMKKAISRGLCRKHYSIASRAVKLGYVTWELLEQRSKALPRVYHDYKKEFSK